MNLIARIFSCSKWLRPGLNHFTEQIVKFQVMRKMLRHIVWYLRYFSIIRLLKCTFYFFNFTSYGLQLRFGFRVGWDTSLYVGFWNHISTFEFQNGRSTDDPKDI